MATVLRLICVAALPLLIGCQSRPDNRRDSAQPAVSPATDNQTRSRPAAAGGEAACQIYRDLLSHAVADVAGRLTGIELTCRTLDRSRCNEYTRIHKEGVSTVNDMIQMTSAECPSLKDELAKHESELERLRQRLERVIGRSTGSDVPVRSSPTVHEAASPSSNQFEFVAADGTYRMAVRDDIVVLSRNAEAAAIHRLQDVQTSRGLTKPILERVAYADLGSDFYFVLSFGTITHASFFRGVRVRKGDLTPLWDEFSPFGVGGNKLIDSNIVYAMRGAFMAAVDLETGKTKWTNVSYDGGQLPSLSDDTRLSVDADGSIVLSDSAWRVVVDSASGAVRSAESSR